MQAKRLKAKAGAFEAANRARKAQAQYSGNRLGSFPIDMSLGRSPQPQTKSKKKMPTLSMDDELVKFMRR